MKSVTDVELDLLLAPLEPLKGARLQKVLYSGGAQFALEFYLGRTYYWIVDLNPRCPLAFLTDRVPFKVSKKTAPLQLFLRANFSGKHLAKVYRDKELGRVVRAEFLEGGLWELRLFPHGQNFSAQAGGKSILFHKPKPGGGRPEGAAPAREVRTAEQILEEWQRSRAPTLKSKEVTSVEDWMAKREKLIEKLRLQQQLLQPEVWARAGEVLKIDAGAELPVEVRETLEELGTGPEKVEFCFAQEKKLTHKKEQLSQRIKELTAELKHPPSAEALKSAPQIKSKSPGEKTQFKTHHHGPWTLWVGRSGADNLKLLRSAKAWYLWLHVRDEPGAHGIVRRNREQTVPAADLKVLGEHFLRMSLPEAARRRLKGTHVEIILAEVRHVRPIKGDKLGRVRYSDSKNLTVLLS